MIDFDYLKASTINEALEYLSSTENIKIIAGGTDVMVNIRNQKNEPNKTGFLLDIGKIKELKFIRLSDGYIEIGPLVTHNMMAESPIIKERFPVLVEAAKVIGSNQIRNRGTIGGNICNAASCADLIPPLMALKTQVTLCSKDRSRSITVEEFIKGQNKTGLLENELLTCIKIPLRDKEYFSYYYKVGRRKALNISRLSIAMITDINENDFCSLRFVPGAVTPYPRVFYKTQEVILSKNIDSIDFEEICTAACNEMISITGERWSTEYKKHIMKSLIKRALETIIKEAKEK